MTVSNKSRRPGTKRNKAQTKLQLASLLANPSIKTITEAASILGLNRSYCSELAQEVKAAISPIDKELDAYQEAFRKRFKTEERANEYIALAKSSDQDMVRLKSLERIDALVGIVTERERREVDSHPTHAPMFYMPGAQVVVQNMSDKQATVPQQMIEGEALAEHALDQQSSDVAVDEPAGAPPTPPSEEDP